MNIAYADDNWVHNKLHNVFTITRNLAFRHYDIWILHNNEWQSTVNIWMRNAALSSMLNLYFTTTDYFKQAYFKKMCNINLQFFIANILCAHIHWDLCWVKNWRDRIWYPYIIYTGRFQWPSGLRRGSATVRLLRSWIRIPPRAWMFVSSDYCVLSGWGLCDELITRPEESYRLWCVVVCDLETSRMGRPWPVLGRSATKKKLKHMKKSRLRKLFA